MKIDLNENAFWATFWIAIGITVTSVSITCAYMYHQKEIKFAEHGMVEVQKDGTTLTLWANPEPTK